MVSGGDGASVERTCSGVSAAPSDGNEEWMNFGQKSQWDKAVEEREDCVEEQERHQPNAS